MIIIKLIFESLRFAFTALKTNPLRTILSLLGVTVGIFAITSVFTIVDSLEKSINENLSFLGKNNLDIRRFPYVFGPIPWWDYIKRPYTTYQEYEYLEAHLQHAEGITIFAISYINPKYKSSHSSNVACLGVSYGHQDVYEFKDLNGRYFTRQETITGKNVAILGYRSTQELFGATPPLGKEISIKGTRFTVIGTIPEEGAGVFGNTSNDENVYIPFTAFQEIFNVGKNGIEPYITVKGSEEDVGLVQLESEIEGLLRNIRGLKPREKSNFSINRQQAILNSLNGIFQMLGIAGWFIGGFSILVGGFGIANIMFVSVRERTSQIGIQKSLGAKNYFILLQFLFESIFLSVIGGGFGLLIVYPLTYIDLGTLNLVLSPENVILGFGISAVVGTLSGIMPAISAARMDPVEAMRA